MRTYAGRRSRSCAARAVASSTTEGREYLDFLCRDRRHLARSRPPGGRRARSPQQAGTLLHVSNLFETELGAEVAATLDRLIGDGTAGRRQGLLLQLRRRGQRVRDQARPALRRAAAGYVVVSRLRLVPRPDAGHAARHRPAGQARGRSRRCPRASATSPTATSTRSARPRPAPSSRPSCSRRSRARAASSPRRPGYLAGGAPALRRARHPADPRRDPDRPRADRAWFALPARRRPARRRDDGQGARQRRAGRRLLGPRRGRRRLRARRPRIDLRRPAACHGGGAGDARR